MSKVVRDSLIIAWLKSFPDLKRNPLTLMLLAMISSIPLFFMVIFAGGDLLVHGLVGAMVSTIGFVGVASAIGEISWDRYIKLREMMVAMPVHPLSYAVGIALAPLLLSLPSLVLFGAIVASMELFSLETVAWTVASLLMCWVATSSLSFLISTYLSKASPYLLNQMSNILGLGLIFIPPVYYPETTLGSLSWVSIIFPTSNAANLIRVNMGLLSLSAEAIIVRWFALVITTVAFIVLTSAKARWRET